MRSSLCCDFVAIRNIGIPRFINSTCFLYICCYPGRVVSVLEGGYGCDNLSACVVAHLRGLSDGAESSEIFSDVTAAAISRSSGNAQELEEMSP